MKQSLITLFLAVMLSIALASCSTTRKATSAAQQEHSTAVVNEDSSSKTQTNDAVAERVTEIDLSNIVIEFTKIEYADGTTDIATTNGADVQHAASQRGDREATEPPNATQKVKSVTSGRVTINSDKKRQEDKVAEHSETAEVTEASNAEVTEDSSSQTEVKQEPKRNLFWWGVGAGFLAVIAVIILLYRLKRK